MLPCDILRVSCIYRLSSFIKLFIFLPSSQNLPSLQIVLTRSFNPKFVPRIFVKVVSTVADNKGGADLYCKVQFFVPEPIVQFVPLNPTVHVHL